MMKLLQIFSFLMAALMSMFSPLQINHGETSCCAECVMKKEEEIEVIDEEVQEDTSD